MKYVKILLLAATLGLAACDSGDSDSGATVEPTQAGNSIPTAFLGIYRGTINITLDAGIAKESDSFPIVFEVKSNGIVTVTVDDEAPENFPINNQGRFSGQASIDEEGCSATLGFTGNTNGTRVTGTVVGEGRCEGISVEADGNFTATK